MSYPLTENGYNMYDLLSLLQKGIRRADYESAGFAAENLERMYRGVLWNRLLIVTSEDCFGVLTKEIVELCKKDQKEKNRKYVEQAVDLLCSAKKSRDACYYACNFVLDSRSPRVIPETEDEIVELYKRINSEEVGTTQLRMDDVFDEDTDIIIPENEKEKYSYAVRLQKAIKHRDMDMSGYIIDKLRRIDREFIWKVLYDYAEKNHPEVLPEIHGLYDADSIFNSRRKGLEKDEIFICKSVLIFMYMEDERFETVLSNERISFETLIDWSKYEVKPGYECMLKNGVIPDWVYDCHTLKGKMLGKTDWDMTVSEQAALTPLQLAYFDEASWLYTYEQDYRNNATTEQLMKPIWEYAKTHSANPIDFLPYEK